jgi:hypothetical protein
MSHKKTQLKKKYDREAKVKAKLAAKRKKLIESAKVEKFLKEIKNHE